jgi:L-seryl-tRNA(Ser) seleniumtransferase
MADARADENVFKSIPSIEQMRQRPAVRALETRFGAEATLSALRAGAATVREALGSGEGGAAAPIAERIEALAASTLDTAFRPSLQPVLNATGVVVHTNLGRAPLGSAALDRVAAVTRGYCSLEYDLDAGARGRRDVHAEPMLCRLTGAEAAVVVNNNAAATLLVLAALAAGREVIVSRGELVEIGGGFRVPDVMAQSGAVLREVGTTNKTRAADYGAAASDRTALILRVHPSNFRIEGFTERPPLGELTALGRRLGVPVAEDLGSGHLQDEHASPLRGSEPSVRASLDAGVDVCCFSGDKLLGGPQAGIIVGRAALVDRLRRHPLMRALRVDKMTYAALESTLAEYAAGRAAATVPVQRMLAMSADDIRRRAAGLAAALDGVAGWSAELLPGVSAVGGGSAPGVELPTWLVSIAVRDLSAARLDARLRALTPPLVGRIEKDRIVLDLRTVDPEHDPLLRRLLEQL